MGGIVRLGDICTGHGDFPPRVSDSASSDVMINNKGVVREGDHWVTHCNSVGMCHDSVSSIGSSSVYVNGKPVIRKGDPIACGSKADSSSTNVMAG